MTSLIQHLIASNPSSESISEITLNIRVLARDDIFKALTISNKFIHDKFNIDKYKLRSTDALKAMAHDTEESIYDALNDDPDAYVESVLVVITILGDRNLFDILLLFRFRINIDIYNLYEQNSIQTLLEEIYESECEIDFKNIFIDSLFDRISAQKPIITHNYLNNESYTIQSYYEYIVPDPLQYAIATFRQKPLEDIFKLIGEYAYASDDSENSASGYSSHSSHGSHGSRKTRGRNSGSDSDSSGSSGSSSEFSSYDDHYESDDNEVSNDSNDSDDEDDVDDKKDDHDEDGEDGEDKDDKDEKMKGRTSPKTPKFPDVDTSSGDESDLSYDDDTTDTEPKIPADLTEALQMAENGTEGGIFCEQCKKKIKEKHINYKTPMLVNDKPVIMYFCDNKCMEKWDYHKY